ncbi:hypothetical protein [Nitrosomonas communis]|nr:hypothetical protein [Nitrosomonas communis]
MNKCYRQPGGRFLVNGSKTNQVIWNSYKSIENGGFRLIYKTMNLKSEGEASGYRPQVLLIQ